MATYMQTLCLIIALHLSYGRGQLVVNTPVGPIQGQTESAGGIVHTFFGIPYAKPPVNDLRFRKPIKPDAFGVQYNASRLKAMCPQYISGDSVWNGIPTLKNFMEEDCLYLNVYVPDQARSLPVMVFIEGEGFLSGRSDIYDSQKLATKAGLIVVTLNYRLDIFGFLWTGDDSAPGNMGLWDQLMALQWVQDNIGAFGGDPAQVTLVGHSAGAASAALHSLSEHSRGLFNRVVCQSGSATSSWAVNTAYEASKYATDIGTFFRCQADNNPNAIVTCLNSLELSAVALVLRTGALSSTDPYGAILRSAWVPVIDGDFIKGDPAKLIQNTTYLTSVGFFDRDFMIGVTSNEGQALYDIVKLNINPRNLNVDNILTNTGMDTSFFNDTIMPALILETFGRENDMALTLLQERYAAGVGGEQTTSYSVVFPPYGDASFVSPAVQLAQAHSLITTGTGSTYFYLFDHSAAYSILKNPHGSELPYVFGLNDLVSQSHSMPTDISTADETFSNDVVKYWSNFVKSGDPNKPDDSIPATWPKFNSTSESYITLTLNMSDEESIRQRLYNDRVSFWLDTLPEIFNTATTPSTTTPTIPSTTTPTSRPRTTKPTVKRTTKSPQDPNMAMSAAKISSVLLTVSLGLIAWIKYFLC